MDTAACAATSLILTAKAGNSLNVYVGGFKGEGRGLVEFDVAGGLRNDGKTTLAGEISQPIGDDKLAECNWKSR